jgi:uncharacterized protein with HEPN domain
MTCSTLSLVEYLCHIRVSIERVERYTADMDHADFLANELARDAVIHNFNIIGDASRNIRRSYPAFAASHPDVDLSFACEMRSLLAPPYGEEEPDIVWKAVIEHLPTLKGWIQDLTVLPANNH